MQPIIKSTADVGNDGIKTLVYGGSGVGKTPFLGTAPTPIILSGEKGLLSLKRNNPPIPYIEFTTHKQLEDAYMWAANSREAQQFYTLGVDSLSEVAEVLLTHELSLTKDPRKAYGELANKGLALVRAFRDIKMKSVVIIAKEEYEKDETTGGMIFQPAMPGKQLGQKIPYFFDETFRMIVGTDANNQPVRYVQTGRTHNAVARDRSGMLALYEQANLTYIYSKILGYTA